jgi:hypothetical protein
VAESLKEIRESVKITNEQIETLVRSEAITRFDNGTYFLNEDWLEKMEVSIDE